MDKKIFRVIINVFLRLLIYVFILCVLFYIFYLCGKSIKDDNNIAAWGQFAILIITVIDSSINNTKFPEEIRRDKIKVALEDFRNAIKPFNETIKNSKKTISKETVKDVFVNIYKLCEKINHPIDLYYLESSKNSEKIHKKIKRNKYLQNWITKYSGELSITNNDKLQLQDLIMILHQYSTDEETIINTNLQSSKINSFKKEFLKFIEELDNIISN